MENVHKHVAVFVLLWAAITASSCTKASTPQSQAPELEALSRMEFTQRIENYFEYEPLRSGKASPVRIHLTDLSDGTPVEKAEVTLLVRPKGSSQTAVETVSKIGKVTGIYV